MSFFQQNKYSFVALGIAVAIGFFSWSANQVDLETPKVEAWLANGESEVVIAEITELRESTFCQRLLSEETESELTAAEYAVMAKAYNKKASVYALQPVSPTVPIGPVTDVGISALLLMKKVECQSTESS